jgi:hypothetical protein
MTQSSARLLLVARRPSSIPARASNGLRCTPSTSSADLARSAIQPTALVVDFGAGAPPPGTGRTSSDGQSSKPNQLRRAALGFRSDRRSRRRSPGGRGSARLRLRAR